MLIAKRTFVVPMLLSVIATIIFLVRSGREATRSRDIMAELVGGNPNIMEHFAEKIHFGKNNIAIPVKLTHSITGDIVYIAIPDLNQLLVIDDLLDRNPNMFFRNKNALLKHLKMMSDRGIKVKFQVSTEEVQSHFAPSEVWKFESLQPTPSVSEVDIGLGLRFSDVQFRRTKVANHFGVF